MPHYVALELAVQDPAGVVIAGDVGARRVLLCSALGSTGGVTPSAAFLEAAMDVASVVPVSETAPILEVHVLVRPRPGGFVYTSGETDLMLHEISLAVEAGADGVVVGALTASGVVDESRMSDMIAAANDAEVTFHRAIDLVPDQVTALDMLSELGVVRVLTSGGVYPASAGQQGVATLVKHSEELGIEVMAGGGIRPPDIPALVGVGVDAVHLSARRTVTSTGMLGGSDAGYEVTDRALAQSAAQALGITVVP